MGLSRGLFHASPLPTNFHLGSPDTRSFSGLSTGKTVSLRVDLMTSGCCCLHFVCLAENACLGLLGSMAQFKAIWLGLSFVERDFGLVNSYGWQICE